MLLWKGIGHYVAANLRYRFLYGPVSISQKYSHFSRGLMVSFFKSRLWNEPLAAAVRPRHAYRVRSLSQFDLRNFASLLSDVDELSEIVADIEADRKSIPILLRQYLTLGARILDFSVD